MTSPKELELTLRLRNNLIKSRRVALGLTTNEAAKKAGINPTTWSKYENFRMHPLRVDVQGHLRKTDLAKYRKSALAIAQFLGVEPKDIFPVELFAVVQPEVVYELSIDEARALAEYTHERSLPPTPEELILAREQHAEVDRAVAQLPSRLRRVIEARLANEEDRTLEEASLRIASEPPEFGWRNIKGRRVRVRLPPRAISRERFRQLESEAVGELKKKIGR